MGSTGSVAMNVQFVLLKIAVDAFGPEARAYTGHTMVDLFSTARTGTRTPVSETSLLNLNSILYSLHSSLLLYIDRLELHILLLRSVPPEDALAEFVKFRQD